MTSKTTIALLTLGLCTAGGLRAAGPAHASIFNNITVSNTSMQEGDITDRPMPFTVSLGKPVTTPVSVDWATVPGTASAGTDYVAASGHLSFAPGVVAKQIAVKIKAGAVTEAFETFTVALSNAVGLPAAGSGVGTINNDDFQPGVSADVSGGSITEGDVKNRNIRVAVQLSKPATDPVVVHLSTAGINDAKSGLDFVPLSTDVTFPKGAVSKFVTITIIPDTFPECVKANEAIRVAISVKSGPALPGLTSNTISICDSDF